MRFLFVSILLCVILTLGILITSVNAETFNTNLTIGSTGTDVTTLQTYLVSNSYLVMPGGVSKGYFGSLTQAAVARWQAIKRITPAVGYFGPISRQVLATEMETTVAISPSSSSSDFSPNVGNDTPTASGMRVNQIMLFRAFPFEVRPGDPITLDGSGFSKTVNNISFNGDHAIIATSTDGITLETLVPANLIAGEYKLSVSNILGSSDNPDITVIIRVTSNPRSGPIIESASVVDGTVTIVGSGFTSANNLITTLGNSSGLISSSGNTLTFRISDLSMYGEIKKFTLGNYQAAFWIYVENEHGVNKEPYKLDIII